MSTFKQQRNLFFIAVLSLLAIAHVMIVNHDGIQSKFYDFAVTTSMTPSAPYHGRSTQTMTMMKEKDTATNHEEKEFVSACLFLDDNDSSSAVDVAEWLAYHYHVLPLRYLIVTVPIVDANNENNSSNSSSNSSSSSSSQQQQPTSSSSSSSSFQQVLDHVRGQLPSLTIVEWTEEDFMTRPIVHHRHVKPTVVTMQERRRIFYYRCVQTLQQQHYQQQQQQHQRDDIDIDNTVDNTTETTFKSAWTWLVSSVQEYLVVPGMTMKQQQQQQQPKKSTSVHTLQDSGLALHWLQWWNQQQHPAAAAASPSFCLQLETWDALVVGDDYDFGEDHAYRQLPAMRALKTTITSLKTWKFRQGRRRRRRHNDDDDDSSTKLIDLSRIPLGDIVPHDRHNHPILPTSSSSSSRNSSSSKCQDAISFVAVMHVGGGGGAAAPAKQQTKADESQPQPPLDPEQDVLHMDVRPWTVGFVQSVGETTAVKLLLLNNVSKKKNEDNTKPTASAALEERCAMLFFGLPRAYDTLVLPSITRNVLIPNARHNCDVFVHYYYMTSEPAGRKNNGGTIDPTAILRLAHEVRLVARNYPSSSSSSATSSTKQLQQRRRVPLVEFTHDTDEAFWHLRNSTVQKYRNTKSKDGQYLYFPYKAVSYVYPSSLDNIVKQWHSIESVWNLMERAMRQGTANYTRVALLRNDVMFITPIDIYRTSYEDQKDDVEGRFAIIPPFGLYPVNDRLVYGSYRAVKIWATKRFEYIEDHVRKIISEIPGHGMHSEIFLKKSIFTAMERDTGVNVTMNPDICFFRTRADNTAMISDCDAKGITRGIENINKEAVVMEISGLTNCTRYKMGYPFEALTCTN